jgi:hypothetical protein
MNLKETALQRAITILQSIDAEYIIRFDGKQYGELPQQKETIRRARFVDEYKKIVDEMNLGDLHTFTVDRDKAEAMRGAITAYCSHSWGNGSYVSEVKKTKVGFSEVSILRVL